ncbi:MAG: TetR family transcriptional regulator [Actinomycetia bacterium]|nr:TetR family transcriptional regulator [Actinomycetes bacterium]
MTDPLAGTGVTARHTVATNSGSVQEFAGPPGSTDQAMPGLGDQNLSDRILAAATELTVQEGWSAITMGKVAHAAGVSRQSVYNEVGSKTELARKMVAVESARFIAAVDSELGTGADLPDAIGKTARRVFEMAANDSMLRAVVAADQSGNTELLPLITTRSEPILAAATQTLVTRLSSHYPNQVPAQPELGIACAALARLVLSYISQPVGNPTDCAQEIAWLAGRFLSADSN